VTLDRLENGQTALIIKLEGTARFRSRLLEMGLVPGTKVLLRRRAPSGDPVGIAVRGYELAIRSADAKMIRVQVIIPFEGGARW